MVFIAVVGGIAKTGGPIVRAVFLVTLSDYLRDHFMSGHLIFYGSLHDADHPLHAGGHLGRFQRLVSPGGGR